MLDLADSNDGREYIRRNNAYHTVGRDAIPLAITLGVDANLLGLASPALVWLVCGRVDPTYYPGIASDLSRRESKHTTAVLTLLLGMCSGEIANELAGEIAMRAQSSAILRLALRYGARPLAALWVAEVGRPSILQIAIRAAHAAGISQPEIARECADIIECADIAASADEREECYEILRGESDPDYRLMQLEADGPPDSCFGAEHRALTDLQRALNEKKWDLIARWTLRI